MDNLTDKLKMDLTTENFRRLFRVLIMTTPFEKKITVRISESKKESVILYFKDHTMHLFGDTLSLVALLFKVNPGLRPFVIEVNNGEIIREVTLDDVERKLAGYYRSYGHVH
jgi:hypothetical protein